MNIDEILGVLKTRLLTVGEPTNKGYSDRYNLRKQYVDEAKQAIKSELTRIVREAKPKGTLHCPEIERAYCDKCLIDFQSLDDYEAKLLEMLK